ncbi:hypothetical protein [Ramlibacter sp.]|uniref:hypothetical protein n=1 Tax=Ramlibacter sp. TaxID=1917967 RepID=UPI003D0BA6F4
MRTLAVLSLLLLVAACGNKPRQPDWLVNADGAQDRFERAYLSGRDRVAEAEFARLRQELSSTGDVALVARGELTRCAMRVASLEFEPCAGFEALRRDAGASERAYADFLEGKVADAKLLPESYRAIAGTQSVVDGSALSRIEEPVSRTIAAGVLLRSGRAGPGVLQAAAETASQQGWRRAVLAWLAAQAVAAERAGNREEAQRLRRRMLLVQEGSELPGGPRGR